MKYWLKEEINRAILLDGRTTTYLANLMKMSKDRIYKILNRKDGTTYQTALLITILCDGSRDVTKLFNER